MANRVIDVSCPDELLSSQWAARTATDFFDMPERRLLLAVLLDAARLIRSGNLKDRKAVGAWIQGADARVPFQALCDGLELEANYVTRHLRRAGASSPGPRRIGTGQFRKIQCIERRSHRPNALAVGEEDSVPHLMSA